MESCLNITQLHYKDIEEYKTDINNVIEDIISQNKRLAFAIVAEKCDVNPFVINKYPELRTYILNQMAYFKEIQVINQKIDRAVINLKKANKTLTFISIINKCKFNSDLVYRNQYLKDKIRNILAENLCDTAT